MAYSESQTSITLPAAADLSAKQYRFVIVNSSGQAALAGDDGNAVGVLQNKPSAAGQAATVCISGVTKVYVGESDNLAAGANIASQASGAGKVADSGSYRLGTCLQAASADGDIISVLFQKNGDV